jgi:hypothetical protein
MSQENPDIETLIERLLHHYECVILPDFGGFIIRDSPCNFNAAKDKIKPYGKHIFFNPHLLQNDGLLYNEIQNSCKLSYQDAISYYQSWLAETRQLITDAGSRKFGHLGTFYKGNENTVWFSPLSTLNLAMESYGLFPIDVRQVITEENKLTPIAETHELIHEEAELTMADNRPIETFRPHRVNYKGWLVAASVALVAHIGYLSFEKNDVTVNQASIIPVIENKTGSYDSMEIADSASRNTPEEASTEIETPVQIQETPVETPAVVETPVVKTPEAQPEPEPKTVEAAPQITQPVEKPAETAPVAPENTMKRVAKYRLESNANYHHADLQKKGIKSEVRQNEGWFEVYTDENIQ